MTRRFALLGAVLLLAASIAGATTLVKMEFSDSWHGKPTRSWSVP